MNDKRNTEVDRAPSVRRRDGARRRGFGRREGAERRREGVAMLLAVLVLAALFLLAVPFAVFMRIQHGLGTQAIRTAQASFGENGALSHAHVVLYRGQSSAETTAAAAPNAADFFPFNDPNVDTHWEFMVTLRTTSTNNIDDGTAATQTLGIDNALGFPTDGDPDTVDGYIRVKDEWLAYSDVQNLAADDTGADLIIYQEHRGLFGTRKLAHNANEVVSFFPDFELWSVEVEDEQAKININTAPLQVITNLLGYAGVGPDPSDVTFPTPRQTDIAAAISSYRLYYSYWENDDNFDGIEAAAENNIPDGSYTRFQNLNMLTNTSLAPWFLDGTSAPLTAEDLDLLRPYITVYSETPAGAVWLNRTTLSADLNQSVGPLTPTTEWAAVVNNSANVPVGSVVRISDAGDTVYRLVTSTTPPGAVLTLNTPISNADVNVWVDVLGPVDSIRLLHMTETPGSEAYTPGYLLIQDAAGDEWIEISEVGTNPGTGNPGMFISGRGQFGTAPVDYSLSPTPITMQSSTIGWRYVSAALIDFAPAVPLTAAFDVGSDVDIENRHAININTVGNAVVLESILNGMTDGTETVTYAEAHDVADFFLEYLSGETAPPYDFFGGAQQEDWIDGTDDNWGGNSSLVNGFGAATPQVELDAIIDYLETTGDISSTTKRDFIKDNFNATNPGAWPSGSTLPLRFTSGTLIGIESIGIVDDPARTPVAQSPRLAQARVYDVIPPLEGTWWALRTQREFYDHMANNSQTALTGGVQYTTRFREDLPPAMLVAESDYDDPDDGVGTVAPGLDEANPITQTDPNVPDGTTVVLGLHEYDPSDPAPEFQLDYSVADDTPLSVAVPMDTTNTTSEGFKDVRLQTPTHYADVPGQRHVEADSFDATIEPFAVEFWVRPAEDVTTRQLLVDIGDPAINPDPDAANALSQARVYLENGRIVLRLDEPIYMPSAGYAGYVVARSNATDFPFEEGVWHHVAIAAVGTFRNEIAMFIDGIYDRNMDWTYEYVDDGGAQHQADETQVKEGYWWPVAMEYPNRNTPTTKGPTADQWPAGMTEIGVADVSWLPTTGWIVIGTTDHVYEYNGFNTRTFQDTLGNWLTVDTIVLTDPAGLQEVHTELESVALMLPVCRTTAHTETSTGAYEVPADTDVVSLWWHAEEVAGNGSYDLAGSTNTYTMGARRTSGAYPNYQWLALPPGAVGSRPIPDAPATLVPDDRWKVLIHHMDHVNDSLGMLSGSLPTGPIGTDLSLGGGRNDTAIFEGELDEVRITALPVLTVPSTGWASGAVNAGVVRWEWDTSGWPSLAPVAGSAFDMADVAGSEFPKMRWGGYFMVDGRIYSYLTWPSPPDDQFGAIAEINDDLTPTGNAGLQVNVEGLRRIIPLNFINTTCLAGAIGANDTTITVADIDQLPATGYVKIENEILAYEQKNGATNELVLTEPFRRGCYGTTAAAHPAAGNGGMIVRALPVRHLDRYRTETTAGTWDVHTTYTDAQLGSQMCMLSFVPPGNPTGDLSGVWWRLKKPLEDGQKLTVLVLVDNDDFDGDLRRWAEVPQSAGAPQLWGEVFSGPGDQSGEIWCDRFPVSTGVEVRFYFDLSETHAYKSGYDTDGPGGPDTDPTTGTVLPDEGWDNMIELDEVGIEMVPQQMTF